MAKRPIPPNRLRELREAQGWSMQTLGEKVGKDASYIYKLEHHKQAMPVTMMAKLAAVLDVPIAEILAPVPGDVKQALSPSGMAQYMATPQQDAKIPVFGTAAASHVQGAQQLLTGPVDYIDAPKALWNARDIYAIYVSGDSMVPMYRNGGIVVVSPHKPARIGDAVIIEEKKGEHAPHETTLGILEKLNGEWVTLRKLNPSAELKIARKYILKIHKVLDTGDLLGVS